jgi:hypothetical protein
MEMVPICGETTKDEGSGKGGFWMVIEIFTDRYHGRAS